MSSDDFQDSPPSGFKSNVNCNKSTITPYMKSRMSSSSSKNSNSKSPIFLPAWKVEPSKIGVVPVIRPRPSQKKEDSQRATKDSMILALLTSEQVNRLVERITYDWEVIKIGEDSKNWCYRSTLPLDGKGGYPKSLRLTKKLLANGDPKVAARNSTASWNAAGVILVASRRYASYPEMEASHLCNHPWCVRANHLVWEFPKANYSRKNCNTHTKCPCGCDHEFNPCTHTPQCLDLSGCTCPTHLSRPVLEDPNTTLEPTSPVWNLVIEDNVEKESFENVGM